METFTKYALTAAVAAVIGSVAYIAYRVKAGKAELKVNVKEESEA